MAAEVGKVLIYTNLPEYFEQLLGPRPGIAYPRIAGGVAGLARRKQPGVW
ncbi:MAG: hypothetical protein WKG07_14520 [Hymenobacter sp.]